MNQLLDLDAEEARRNALNQLRVDEELEAIGELQEEVLNERRVVDPELVLELNLEALGEPQAQDLPVHADDAADHEKFNQLLVGVQARLDQENETVGQLQAAPARLFAGDAADQERYDQLRHADQVRLNAVHRVDQDVEAVNVALQENGLREDLLQKALARQRLEIEVENQNKLLQTLQTNPEGLSREEILSRAHAQLLRVLRADPDPEAAKLLRQAADLDQLPAVLLLLRA